MSSDEDDTAGSMCMWEELEGPSPDSIDFGEGAQWTVSSCKAGCGVERLRDDDPTTFWQSDGAQPHTVCAYFRERVFVESVCFYVDYESDETYTPSRVCAKVGTMPSDMVTVSVKDLDQPRGWITLPLTNESGHPSHVFMVELCVVANHQNGRDTHIRQCKVFAKNEPLPQTLSAKEALPRFSSAPFRQFNTLR